MRKTNLQSVPAYPASTLPKLMRGIRECFTALEPSTSFYIGERYGRQDGKPRRVMMIPNGGTIGGVLGVGESGVAGLKQTCTAYLWGAETADDLDRYDDVEALLDRFVNVLKRIAGSRVKDAPVVRMGSDEEPGTDVLTFGEDYRVIFSFEREVPRDLEVWNYAIPAPDASQLSPPPYDAPPGTPASTIKIDLSTVPKE